METLTKLPVAIALSGLLASCGSEPAAEHAGSLSEAIEQGLDEREQLDQTVWAGETEAQRFEQVFVKLWSPQAPQHAALAKRGGLKRLCRRISPMNRRCK